MPPGRRPIPSEEERRILEKEAIFRAMIEAGQTTKSFGRPGIGGLVGSVAGRLFEPVIKDLAADAEQQNLIKQYADRANAEQAPIDYYKSLPNMKQTVLADMAMGISPSADAQEGIREQRMANAPYKFPSDWANQQTAQYGGFAEEAIPQYFLTGQYEKPKFVVGEISQPTLDERDEVNEYGGDYRNFGSNWTDKAIRNLQNGQVLLITGSDNPPPSPPGYGEAYDTWYKKYKSSSYVPYVVVVKEDGIVYQREVTPEVYASYKDAMRTGYPVGTEQLLIDEISSLSQQPRVEQDSIWNNIPANQRSLKLLSYILPSTMDREMGDDVGAFVLGREGLGTGITARDRSIPKPDPEADFLNKQPGTYMTDYTLPGARNILTHEYAHVFDKPSLVDNPSERSEFRAAATFDMENSSEFADAEFDPEIMGNYASRVTPGELGATSYGNTSFTEDFAERFAMWQLSDRFGHIAFDRNGNKLTYEDIWPRTARLFEELMTERPRKN
jgi:hypothetical protein